MAKEKEARRPFNLKREVKLLPGYIILLLWVIFTIALLGWVFGASFSTTAEIFQGKALKFESGLHFENYAKAWNGAGVAGFFGNSLIYSVISCTILILVCAPAAYVLSRFDFMQTIYPDQLRICHGCSGNHGCSSPFQHYFRYGNPE